MSQISEIPSTLSGSADEHEDGAQNLVTNSEDENTRQLAEKMASSLSQIGFPISFPFHLLPYIKKAMSEENSELTESQKDIIKKLDSEMQFSDKELQILQLCKESPSSKGMYKVISDIMKFRKIFGPQWSGESPSEMDATSPNFQLFLDQLKVIERRHLKYKNINKVQGRC